MSTHSDAVFVRECLLDLIEADQFSGLEIVGKAESLDVLLQPGGDLPLVAPETVPLELSSDGGEDELDFAEFLARPRRGSEHASTIALVAFLKLVAVFVGLFVGEIVGENAVEEKDDLFREVGDVAALLLYRRERGHGCAARHAP